MYADVFEDRPGKMNEKVSLQIDASIRPVQLPTRKIPIAVKEQLREELRRLENLGVISRVDEPTDWVSSLVIARKKTGNSACV